jgi:hypothetical protein
MEAFVETFRPGPETRILDVGGTPLNWTIVRTPARVTLVNVYDVDMEGAPPNVELVRGDGTDLPFEDGSFDIAYSNSVIEHLGTAGAQERFASELRRVGRGVWVQTPAASFPVEAHLLTPLVHYLPKGWQRRVVRRGTVWGLLTRPEPQRVDDLLDELRLLGRRDMARLFPDCEIRRERLLGLTKAYVAVRRGAP